VFPTNPRALLLALATSLALAATAGEAKAQEPTETELEQKAAVLHTARIRSLQQEIRTLRKHTWHWQRVMGKPRSPSGHPERWTRSIPRLIAMREAWRKRQRRVVRRARNVPHEASWRCIHRYEGAWDDPNGLYYGGLQMDAAFQRTYGRYLLRRKGTADRWRPLEQMWTAEKARRSGRGFYPWPTTARLCGLL
jgi:hypothetical protein